MRWWYPPVTLPVPLPLSFVYHGVGATETVAKSSGLQDAPGAAASGIFVYPQGIPFQTYGVGWDDTCAGYDMVFLDRMVAALEARYCIDTKRIFVAGFSWGRGPRDRARLLPRQPDSRSGRRFLHR